jgi:antitoxin component of RelBE/YafQ-DinJ toxin-antitoxin module
MSRKKQFQTRLDPDVADRVEQYADENDLSNSEAVRRLVRQGIEASGGPTRDEIAADLKEVRSAVRGVRRELDTDDDPDGQLQRAGQVGTVVSVVVTAVLTGLTVLVVGGLL